MEITIHASEPPDAQWTLAYWCRILDSTSLDGKQKMYDSACWALEMSKNPAWDPYIEAARGRLAEVGIRA